MNCKIRPLFVHTDARVQALAWITMVALQPYSLIEWEAKKDARDLDHSLPPPGVCQGQYSADLVRGWFC